MVTALIITALGLWVLLKDRTEKDDPVLSVGFLISTTLLISPIYSPPHIVLLFIPMAWLTVDLVRQSAGNPAIYLKFAALLLVYLFLSSFVGDYTQDTPFWMGLSGFRDYSFPVEYFNHLRRAILKYKIPYLLTFIIWLWMAASAWHRNKHYTESLPL